ncbi:MAG: D-aminoacyl-tRNA deacylase [Candidatus Poseidoniaceae archaeon]
MAEVILIAVNGDDIASTNQAKFLLENNPWEQQDDVETYPSYAIGNVRMWFLPNRILWEDYLDQRWRNATGEDVTEVIFPSRHAAVSGQPCLTLHPIGVPHHPIGEEPPFGGRSGFAPPPNPRIASWWRLLHQKWEERAIPEFSLSLEVTHHGPILDVPALFIEVGSTEPYWPNKEAAKLLAEIIGEGLDFENNFSNSAWTSKNIGEPVLITLGGGHYAPKANKLALEENVWLGHMLANHSLPFGSQEDPGILWKQSIDAAVSSTKKAFPGGNVVCNVEKKSFKGWQRQLIYEHLESIGIEVVRTNAFLEMVKGCQAGQ